MQSVWKFVWDVTATIFGLYAGWKVFLLSGEYIPMLGYFPIGLILGLLALGIGARIIHLVELFACWILWQLFGVKVFADLPFDNQ